MSTHTPTPKYRAELRAHGGDHAGWSVVSDDGLLCMYCSEAEARMIATACNSHDELLALAKQYASECSECDGTGILTGEIGFEEECPDCADIRAVIAKVAP